MLEVLRVHAGFESSWNWNEAVDVSKTEPNSEKTEEAGPLQCSCNSLKYGADLQALFAARSPGDTSCQAFMRVSKKDHRFAMEYDARPLRHTLQHHGPVKRREINAWLRRDAVAEFEALLARELHPTAAPPAACASNNRREYAMNSRARWHLLASFAALATVWSAGSVKRCT